ncbi:MAG: hypothetical protein JWP91_2862 [Fibrobacteres bacterium]|nr:hypothetical protein [Fibrobacterota bacterium]
MAGSAKEGAGQGGDAGDAGKTAPGPERPRRRVWLSASVFLATLLLALLLHRCQEESLPPASILPPLPTGQGPAKPPVQDTFRPPPETTVTPPPKITKPLPRKPDSVAAPRVQAPVDSGPYLWADPWGGRHFDSVRVTLHCREGCLVLYSLEDSVHFKSYEEPLVFKRNATLWISGIDSLNRQAQAIRVDYVIERNPGACAGNSMPLVSGNKTVCMDLYEWPDSDNAVARAFVSQQDAADSCRAAGKRLCTAAEWREGCQGPDHEAYPYGGKYNENRCPAKEPAASRSGRFPVCRSYYGLYDMTGNLWEWTSTPGPDPDFFMVAGGNWTAGNEATCGYAKFSFYPKVRYPFVGFRCCQDVGGK